jgi:predicted DNA-binding transcriptional regulator AlpA
MEADMSGRDTGQSVFDWPFEKASEPAEPEDVPLGRPPAPPAARGGAAGERTGARTRRTERSRPPERLPADDELWDVHAAARFLKRSVSWVYHRAEDGTLPVRRLGGWGIRFIPAELRAWVTSSAGDGRRR